MRSLIFIGLLTIVFHTIGQSFKGRVLDAESNQPLPYATIYLPDTDNGVIADAEGRFEITSYPRSIIRLQISSVGYESLLEEIDASKVNEREFRIKPSHFELKELIISFPAGKLSDENVVEVEKIPLSPLNGGRSINLATTLANMPGVDQVTTGSGIGKPVIRGLTGNRIVTYTQGIRLENQQFGDEHGLGENAIGVSRVEVIKGPASLLYGADALGGVLYLVDERYAAMNKTEGFISSQFLSNTSALNSGAGLKINKNGIKWNLFGAHNSNRDYKIPNGKRVENTRFDETSVKSSLGYNMNNWVGNVRFGHLENRFGIPEGTLGDEKNRKPEVPFQKIVQNNLSLENVYFAGNSELSLILGLSSNRRKEFEDDEDVPVLDMELNTITYNLKSSIPLGDKTTLISGLQGMRRENSNAGEEILIPDSETTDVGFYSMLNSSLSERLNIQSGFRVDHRKISTTAFSDIEKTIPELERTFSSFNFSAGGIYKLSKLTFRANVATGFRPPNTAELLSNGEHEGTLRYEIGNQSLENERAIQTDLNIQFENEHLTIGVNPFYNRIKDYIYISPTGALIDGSEVYEYLQVDAKLYGAEIGIHFHPHSIHWLHLETNFASVYAEDDLSEPLPLIPANRIQSKLSAEIFLKKKVDGNLYVEHLYKLDQDRVSSLEETTDSYHLLNLGSTFEVGSFMFEAGINNVLNTRYIDHLSRLKPEGIPNQGRNIFIGTKFNF